MRAPRRWICALALCAALPCGATARAQGRYEGTSEAEKLLKQGQQREGDAEARKQRNPAESRALYEDALELYEDALEADPGLLEAYVRLGYAHYALGQPEEAARRLSGAIARWPQSERLRRVYGTVLFGLPGRRAEAVGHLQAAAAATPDAYDVFFLLGKHHYEAEQWAEAARWLRRYLEFAREDASAHGTMGNIYLRLEKYEPALAEFRLVLSLEPGNLSAQVNIANIRFKQRRFEEAARLFDEVLTRQPDLPEARFNLASSLYELGRHADAIAAWEAFLRLRPGHLAARYMIAAAQIERRAPDAARLTLAALVKDAPDMARARWRLGLLELARGQLPAARAQLEEARRLEPENPWFLKGLGDVLRAQGELNEALAVHLEALRLAPREPQVRASLCRDRVALGDLKAAREEIEAALALAPDAPALRALGGAVLLRQAQAALASGDAEGAEAALARLRALGVLAPEAALLEGALALEAGDLERAAAALREAQRLTQGAPCEPARCLPREALRLEGLLALARGDTAGALRALRATLEQDTTRDPLVANALGRALAQDQQWEQALVWFSLARRLGMAPARVERNLGLASIQVARALGQQERWKQALELLNESEPFRAALRPDEAVALDLVWSVALTETNSGPQALARLRAVERALKELSPQDRARLPSDDALGLGLRQAWLLHRLGQDERVVELLARPEAQRGPRGRDAVRLLAASYVALANKQYKAGRLPQARDWLQKASALSKGRDEIIQHNLAVLEHAQKPGKRSLEVFRALSVEGRVPEASFNLAIALDGQGDARGAYEGYVQAQRRGVEPAEAAARAEAKRRVFGF